MPGRTTQTVRLTGPFFQLDPDKVVAKNIVALLGDFAQEQAGEVRRLMESRSGAMPFWTGRTASTVEGRVSNLSGRNWHRHAVVSTNTAGMSRKDAIRIKAAGSTIERRWHPFSRVARKSRKITRDLTKGLN